MAALTTTDVQPAVSPSGARRALGGGRAQEGGRGRAAVPGDAHPGTLLAVTQEQPDFSPGRGFWVSSCRGRGHPKTSSLGRRWGAHSAASHGKVTGTRPSPHPQTFLLLTEEVLWNEASLKTLTLLFHIKKHGGAPSGAQGPAVPGSGTEDLLLAEERGRREPQFPALASRTDLAPACLG